MELHPDKCEVNSITRKKNPVKYPYALHDNLLKHVDVVKYLGVQISHMDYVTAKANSTLGFVHSNFNINSSEVRERAYKTLVRPILAYISTVWDPTPLLPLKSVSQCNEELLTQP